jgi:hypothetical protein
LQLAVDSLRVPVILKAGDDKLYSNITPQLNTANCPQGTANYRIHQIKFCLDIFFTKNKNFLLTYSFLPYICTIIKQQ